MKVQRGGKDLATVHKALVGIRDRFEVDIETEEIQGEGKRS